MAKKVLINNQDVQQALAERPAEKVKAVANRKVSELPEGYSFGENGLNYLDPHNDNASPILICSKLEVTASTRDKSGNNWGRVLELRDKEGRAKKWVMPMDMLAGRGDLLHGTLLNMGLMLNNSAKAKNLLAHYIQACGNDSIAVCVDKPGWFEECYVLPNSTIGSTDGKKVMLQTAYPGDLGFSCAGTQDEWRDNVAVLARGNSRIAFSISAAFTAPLLSPLGIEGGGFHFRGESSKGKTLTLYAGGSVWGGHERLKTWRATSNGLEMTAFQHNDSLLLLDEMGEMNPKDIGQTVYMLANGHAKQRMNEAQPKQWRVLFLSTGEIDLKSAMSEAGLAAKAGQEVRMVDIEAVAGEYGVFDCLTNGFNCSRTQAEHLRTMTGKYYGTVGRMFLERFIGTKEGSLDMFKAMQAEFLANCTPPNANSQVKRVLNRFAIVAAGGELATHFGLTGWPPGEASAAAKACFDSWLGNLSNAQDSQEEAQAIERIRLFIMQHGESRFTDLDNYDEKRPVKTIDRVGYKERDFDNGVRVMMYLFDATTFKSIVCKGISHKTAIAALKKRGYLKHEKNRDQHLSKNETDNGRRERFYTVKSTILESD